MHNNTHTGKETDIMEIKQERNGENLILHIDGRVDTKTAPELEVVLKEALNGVSSLIFDLEKVPYMSSAGLRVLLVAQKQMNAKGKMKVINANEDLMEWQSDTIGFDTVLMTYEMVVVNVHDAL